VGSSRSVLARPGGNTQPRCRYPRRHFALRRLPSREDAHLDRCAPHREVAPRKFLRGCQKLPPRWTRISSGGSTRSHRHDRQYSAPRRAPFPASSRIRRTAPHRTQGRPRSHETPARSGATRILAAQIRCALRQSPACSNRAHSGKNHFPASCSQPAKLPRSAQLICSVRGSRVSSIPGDRPAQPVLQGLRWTLIQNSECGTACGNSKVMCGQPPSDARLVWGRALLPVQAEQNSAAIFPPRS
jgi:hypothetical protein